MNLSSSENRKREITENPLFIKAFNKRRSAHNKKKKVTDPDYTQDNLINDLTSHLAPKTSLEEKMLRLRTAIRGIIKEDIPNQFDFEDLFSNLLSYYEQSVPHVMNQPDKQHSQSGLLALLTKLWMNGFLGQNNTNSYQKLEKLKKQ